MASASNSNENIPEMGWKWDEVYQCFRFNGVLFPIPLNEKHPFEDVVRRERNLRRATRVEMYPDIDNRSNLTIAQRAQGTWLVQLRERNESQKMEKVRIF
ncbi:hypothetical protein AAHA92_31631 [Salvia divinorum]|uniref:Uncharacterized protein n=1 Tax=Salvia divinorum TaxID=28513 RepID=A0ABD1FJ12_SALDI